MTRGTGGRVRSFVTAVLGAACLLAAASFAWSQAPSQAREHAVLAGDTLYDLAQRYDTSVAELRRLNDLDGDLLRVGTVLRLPGPDGWTEWEVGEGRTWSQVADATGRLEATLRTANPGVPEPSGVTVRVPPHDGSLAAPRPGEDLIAFAARVGVAPGALVARNGLDPPYALDPAAPLLLAEEGADRFGVDARAAAPDAEGAAATAAPTAPDVAGGIGGSVGDGRLPSSARHDRLRQVPLRELPTLLSGVVLRPPDDGFAWPLAVAPRITSRFGWRNVSVGGNRYHQGLDLGAPTGTPVFAVRDGVVARTGWIGAYGYAVVLRHEDGFETRYAHLSRIEVEAGRTVTRGAQIGRVGTTGASTGPHLHFEVRRDGRALDPLTVLPDPDAGRIATR
ncbi:MAG: LysM peptidoglycan-binding domain-containing M23 family metallopeptidase [Trueperaceae bacterium]